METMKKSGRWSDDEHDRFLGALESLKDCPDWKKWPMIAKAVGTRTTLQCRSHAQKYFLKLRRHDRAQAKRARRAAAKLWPPPMVRFVRNHGARRHFSVAATLARLRRWAVSTTDTAKRRVQPTAVSVVETRQTPRLSEHPCLPALSCAVS